MTNHNNKKRVPCQFPMNLFCNFQDEVPSNTRVSSADDCEGCDEKDCEVEHCLMTEPEQLEES